MEKLDKQFGIVAIESGFITPEQLLEAVRIQVYEDLEGTKHRLIGEILRAKGYITTEQIDEVLKLMGIP
ncbi:MAG: hypothetical protein JSV38_03475 [Desulfobacterales bacterium]|nr:MAG: hypothetical protein JSV38_03475 [Desulfobacterales bacterium]